MGTVTKSITIQEGVGSKSGKPYSALKVVIGDYETLLFPTKFEMRYLKTVLGASSVAPQPPTVAEATDTDKADAFLNDPVEPFNNDASIV